MAHTVKGITRSWISVCPPHVPHLAAAVMFLLGKSHMLRAVIVLMWISLLVGTYVTGNVVGNWLVCLLGIYLFIRSRRGQPSRVVSSGSTAASAKGPRQPVPSAGSDSPHSRVERRPSRRWH